MSLDNLKQKYSWATEKPKLEPDPHGWFGWVHEILIENVLPPDASIIVELGSWLGKSTRFILDHAPEATLMAVDHWGVSELIANDDPNSFAKMANLYDTFLVNCWEYQNRLIPVRQQTTEGLQEIFENNISPNFIYIDANHTYEDCKKDLELSYTLFPHARLAGDDYGGKWDGVKKAVDEFCHATDHVIFRIEHAWALYKSDESQPYVSLEEIEERRINA